MQNKKLSPTENHDYTDGFPVNDNPDKKEGTESRDPSRPFDSGRAKPDIDKKKRNYNPTGTFFNEPDKYKK